MYAKWTLIEAIALSRLVGCEEVVQLYGTYIDPRKKSPRFLINMLNLIHCAEG